MHRVTAGLRLGTLSVCLSLHLWVFVSRVAHVPIVFVSRVSHVPIVFVSRVSHVPIVSRLRL